MLSARNLCGLLSENTDEHVSEYVVFTTHGTLLGYSDTTIIKKARKVAALLGVTWRSANQAQPSNKQDDSEGTNSGTLLLKILTTIRDADGKTSIMTVEIDKMIAAICDVKESLLVAALLEETNSSSRRDQVSELVSDDDDDDDEDTGVADVKESSKATHNIASTEIEPLKPSPDSGQELEEEDQQESSMLTSSKGKSEGGAEGSDSTPTRTVGSPSLSSSPSSSSSKPKPSQMQILIWRAEAMAEALREDLRDFKMPQGIL